MYSKKLIKCLHCGTEKQQSRHSSTGKYCSNRCQVDFQYAEFVKRWLAGKESGTSGQKGISLHVRRYVFEKYDSKCVQCGWCTPHPADGRVPLEVDHIDGNWENTTESNLRLLCPNCHSLTSTYKSRNKKSSRNYKPK
jgi:endogenous inhibitor of DNA gyrase (YacG/DUF329 family)